MAAGDYAISAFREPQLTGENDGCLPVQNASDWLRPASTEDQAHDAQLDELRAAGCAVIHQVHGSGSGRARPVLAWLIREIKPGEVLVVVRSTVWLAL